MRLLAVIVVLLGAGLFGCNDPFAILPASIQNTVDTLELFAVNGTGLRKPSGYFLTTRAVLKVGVDPPPVLNAPPFDFLFRLDAQGNPEFAPFYSIASPGTSTSTAGQPGLQVSTTAFDAITEGQQIGYTTDQPIGLTTGMVLFARSSLPNNCFLGIPYYAKIEIISFDQTARSVKFRILTDINCGYRGLEPGLPKK